MSTTEAQRKASKKYITGKLDEVRFRVPKGEREVIKAHAQKMGESVNGFIYRAVKEAIERDNEKQLLESNLLSGKLSESILFAIHSPIISKQNYKYKKKTASENLKTAF